jgi:GNAT superfamily N-acetyltransferase
LTNITILDGFEKMNYESVTRMLSQAYWCPGIKIEEVIQAARNSALVVGAFLDEGEQVGYARAISDKTRFAYILDVYVDEPYRKQGIGQKMVSHILAHDDLKDVYQWLLITKDAHGVYGKVGFTPVSRPLDWMEIRRQRPDR